MAAGPRQPNTIAATRPAPWPLVLRLLGPALLLALFAAIAIVRDWRSARTEAVARANELVAAVVARMTRVLEVIVPDPGKPEGFAFIREVRPPWSVDWFRVGATNELLHPRSVLWPPQPEIVAPDADGNDEWRPVREALEGARWAAVVERCAALLGSADVPGSKGLSPRIRALALFERALALERDGRTNDLVLEFERAFQAAASGETTEAGVPIAPLAGLRILDLANGSVPALPESWRLSPERLAREMARVGSPFASMFFERIDPLLPDLLARASAQGLTPFAFREIQAGQERARVAHALLARRYRNDVPWPAAMLVDDLSSGQIAVEQRLDPDARSSGFRSAKPNGRVFALLPDDWIASELRDIGRELEPRGDYVLRLEVAGRNRMSRTGGPDAWGEVPGLAEELAVTTRATAAGATFTVGVALHDTATFFAGQRRRAVVFGTLVFLALAVSAASVLATHRALVRQHELNLQKSNFVSSVSHELRAPLGSIRLLAEGLERGTAGDEAKRGEYYRLIGDETRRLGALVENVLDFSRIEQGRQDYERGPTDLAALVLGSVRVFEPLATDRGVRVEVGGVESDVPVELIADGRALQQALLNLLDNALKHSPNGAVIRVELAVTAGEVRLSVADSGPGLPASEFLRIFEPFYRRGSELRRETRGVGIGLSIVKHVVEAHGGRVEVVSEPGRGATFILVLPLSKPCES